MNTRKHNKAFTLVELIIVIMILAILSTIAFISFQNYTSRARDSQRLSNLSALDHGLNLFFAKSGVYPPVDQPKTVFASGTVVSTQGDIGESVARVINLNEIPLDPLDQSRYIYALNSNQSRYQILALLESSQEVSLAGKVYADEIKNPITKGDGVGILLQSDFSGLQETGVDLLTTESGTIFKAYFGEGMVFEGSGASFITLYSIINKNLAPLDTSLAGYWDMESTTESGGVLMLKDLSKNGLHGYCYDNGIFDNTGSELGTIVNCGSSNGPQLTPAKIGKAMNFDGNDYVSIHGSGIYNDNMTYLLKITPKVLDSSYHGIIGDEYYHTGATRRADLMRTINLYTTPTNILQNGGIHYDIHNALDTAQTRRFNDFKSNPYNPNLPKQFTIATKKDGEKFSLKSNGIVLEEKTMPYTQIVKTDRIWLGRVRHFFIGEIDEVRVYNRALSDQEIDTIYKLGY